MAASPRSPQGPPSIAVVIPVHNGSALLRDTLQSVQRQSLTDWELIVLDDGSRDDSAAIATAIARDDPRIRVITQPNAGVSIARNRGVAASAAPLIAFLDADDLWHPDKLRCHVERHQGDAGLGVSFARVEFLSPGGQPTGKLASHPGHALTPVDFLCENPTTTTSNWVLRRDVFREVGGFVEKMSYSEDLEWLLRVACQGRWRIEPIERVLTYYRTSAGGLSASLERMEEGWLALIAAARGYAPEVVERHFAAAQAVHLRYLARRSLRLQGDPALGADFMVRALRSDWRLLIRQPRRTGLTALAVVARLILQTLRRWPRLGGWRSRAGPRLRP
ncbi:glycosyltransferase family A protein [Cyanobium sp. Morenito 9A2]|uniref:glycosyltransferase family 2 protein n=1 Tax=Cyanobium sp. Morenito 9A2 TaxID=2823718 RepID=UPI0020CF32C6|nr:glycosyltransferase family A protein [Cyanobium sp. Morenito 9A2]MCP9849449.1 glycosyltransferase family 2 protein [Cyanobium sp. Morenito 9A2]